MDRTPFAGLTVVEPDESPYEDGASFLARNPRFIDYLLRLGAKTHRHNGAAGLSNPPSPPTLTINQGGYLPSDTTFHVGFTLVDADGGETMVSPLATVTTPGAMAAPSAAPGVTVASGTGLPIGTYYYAVTLTDGQGGETTPSPPVAVTVTTASRITLKGLNAIRGTDGFSVVVYKSTGGAFFRVAETIADTFVDDGTLCADCTLEPPTSNTTFTEWALDVAVPSAAVQGATSVRIYASLEESLASPALVTELASGVLTTTFSRTQFSTGSPPPISLSKGGANLIDPDTELIDWHWKRPVTASGALPSGAPGDVRLVLTPTPTPYAVGSASAAGPSGWRQLVLFGPAGPTGPTGPTGSAGPALIPKGTWAAASAYAQYSLVDIHGSSYWASAAAAPGVNPPLAPWVLSAEKGDKGDQGYPGMRWQGEWDSTRDYLLDSLVTLGNELWVAAASGVAAGMRPGSAIVSFRGREAYPLPYNLSISDQILSTDYVTSSLGTTPGVPYYFDVTDAGSVTVRFDQQTGHTFWDGVASLYSAAAPTTPITSDDNSAGNLMPLITATLSPGRYFVVLQGNGTLQYGYYRVLLTGSAQFGTAYAGYWDRVFSASGLAGGGAADGTGYRVASGVTASAFVQRSRLVFLGSGVAVTDDAANDGTRVTFDRTRLASGVSGEYPARKKIAVTAPGVFITDDAANDRVVVTIPAPSASPPEGRADVVVTTASGLASGVSELGVVTLGPTSRLLRVVADKACRVRLYTQATKRTADASRAIGTDPTGDHGLAFEAVFTSSLLSLDLSPQPIVSNMDSPTVSSIYYNIMNMAAASGVAVTFTRQRMEY